ncbi:nicastrin [Aricia agestis]|uniref:nicastrin n=1 Tax=Aricia agestis TaxID=91739 RepID=UPI001C205201|nr:nicastrin [Aricia agestis]
MKLFCFGLLISFSSLFLKGINSERLHEQIYSSIEGSAACFRRLNGTHQAGCSSSFNGAVGVVHMVRDISHAQWVVYNATAGPYMPVVSTSVFNIVIELLLEEPSNIAGILVFHNATARPSSFSHELKCPNEYYNTKESKCPSSNGLVWNEIGTGLLRRDIPYPIFYLPNSKIDVINQIEQCFERFNLDLNNQKGNPLCSLQLNSFMYAAVNTVTCLRRSASSDILTATKVCDPLGDYNVYYSLFPRSKETEPKTKPVTLVTARIDTASLFDGVAPGAASSVIGLVGLITTASVLSKMIPVNDSNLYDNNVLFTLFNGESYDYIGSQRVAYDISQESWPPLLPLNSEQIPLHVELGQIGGSLKLFKNNSWPMYAYAPYTDLPAQITEFLAKFSNYLNEVNMTVTPKFTMNLPPSSVHSFRRILKNATESAKLSELLLVDHGDTFTNKYYESVLDDEENIGYVYHNISIGSDGTFVSTEALLANGTMKAYEAQVKLARLATALARTLYQEVTGKPYSGNVSASAHMVDEVLYCFLSSQACRVLAAADYGAGSAGAGPPERPAPLYVGVAAAASPAALYAGHALALLTGDHLTANKTECDVLDKPGYTYYWLRGWNLTGVCIQTTMNFSAAVSPAFIISDYDMTSGVYSSWTESVWQAMWARVFVSAGGGGARAAGAAGAVVTLLAALLTWRLQKDPAMFTLADRPASSATGILGTVNC